MEEDDEFGDLYADVLHTIIPSPNPPIPSPPPPPPPPPPKPQPATPEESILGPAPIPEDNPEPSSPPIRAPEPSKPEGDQGIGDFDIELDIPGVGEGVAFEAGSDAKPAGSDEWDSDSEDDLRIVLNDDDGVEDDEDGEDDLVIVADGVQHHHRQYQTLEEPEWAEEALQAAPDGERKEAADAAAAAVKGAVVGAGSVPSAGPRGAFTHGYHPQHHSQFKYIRPGAVDTPGGAPVYGGGPGQVRPPLTMGLAAGRGRGAQKGFYSGYGWANNSMPRPFGIGLDFTLPSHKTIFDVNIDVFDEKPWRLTGIDVTDFFNFGLDEASWKEYCKQLEQYRLESTMQSKIRVYEIGRNDPDYDADLPPELAAASGLQDLPAEKAHAGKTDSGQLDLFSQGMAAPQRQLPTGRAIQVESGYGERLPSMDTRPPRTRDFEAVIEIVCQDFVDESDKSNMEPSQPSADPTGDGSKGCCGSEEHNMQDDPECNGHLPHLQHDKRDDILDEAPTLDSSHNNAPEVSSCAVEHLEEPQNERKTIERKDMSMDDVDADNDPEQSPSSGVEKMKEPSTEPIDADLDEGHLLTSSPVDRDDLPPDLHVSTGSRNDHGSSYSTKKQKLSSQVEHPTVQANGDAEDLKTSFSDYGNAKSGSSLEYMKQGEGDEDEVMQAGGSRDSDLGRDCSEGHGGSPCREDYMRDPQHVINGGHVERIPPNGREDFPRSRPRGSLESNSVEYECIEAFERSEGRGTSSGMWNRRDSQDLTRKDKDAKRRQSEEMRLKDRSRTLLGDRKSRGDDPYPRKSNDTNEWRGSLRQRESSVLMKQHDYFEDVPTTRRKDDEQRKRESVSKESLHGHHIREDASHSRRGRSDGSEHRIKEDAIRVRDRMANPRSSKHKDDSSKQREREERQRLKVDGHMHTHRVKEDLRSGAKSGRSLEDKSYGANLKIRGDRVGSDNDPVSRRHDSSRRGERTKGESHSQHKTREELNVGLPQVSREEKSSRHGRLNQSAHNSGAFSNRHIYREMDREKSKKSKNLADHNGLVTSKRKYEDYTANHREKSRQTSPFDSSVKITRHEEPDNASDGLPPKKDHHVSVDKTEGSGDLYAKNRDETISDDENQQESRRGRSKLERWTSHKERDYTLHRGQSSSSLRADDMNGNNRDIVLCDELTMTEANKDAENVDNKDPTTIEKEERDRHLETVEKLKKRSERFNLPMPGEKETLAMKKVEGELPLVQNEPVESEVKQERPTRKRKWVSG